MRPQIGQFLRNFESQRGHEVSYKKKRVMNQLPSEIFVLWSVSFLIKLSCKKLPPSLVKCVFFASMYPRQVKMSNVYLNFFCLNFRWGEKLDIKIWFYCFQFPRVQILLFVGWNSIRVKKSKSKRKILFTVCCFQRVEQQVLSINYRCLYKVASWLAVNVFTGGHFDLAK